MHTHSLYIQDNQKALKVVNTASPYCSFEDCATKLNYVYAWLILFLFFFELTHALHVIQQNKKEKRKFSDIVYTKQ